MPRSFQDLPQSLQDELVAHHKEESQREAVGLILLDQSTIRLKNWSRKPDKFMVLYGHVLRRLGWKAFSKGSGIAFVYHSHSVSSYPSSTDKTFMSYLHDRWPEVDHLIYVPGLEYSIWQYGG
jgi:proteasome lid subunit RPN8/RPN11